MAAVRVAHTDHIGYKSTLLECLLYLTAAGTLCKQAVGQSAVRLLAVVQDDVWRQRLDLLQRLGMDSVPAARLSPLEGRQQRCPGIRHEKAGQTPDLTVKEAVGTVTTQSAYALQTSAPGCRRRPDPARHPMAHREQCATRPGLFRGATGRCNAPSLRLPPSGWWRGSPQ
ncbi:hypothetical protein GSU75_03674 [Pseudomonas savastanoi pv. phaseolicola]|nr:hypothetical protein [Pseudomonas savastanoi pv. phaseolicola]